MGMLFTRIFSSLCYDRPTPEKIRILLYILQVLGKTEKARKNLYNYLKELLSAAGHGEDLTSEKKNKKL
jgi:hypothetical protein